jgi:hypothetical protein
MMRLLKIDLALSAFDHLECELSRFLHPGYGRGAGESFGVAAMKKNRSLSSLGEPTLLEFWDR